MFFPILYTVHELFSFTPLSFDFPTLRSCVQCSQETALNKCGVMWNSFNESRKNVNLIFFIGSFVLFCPVPCLNTLSFFDLFLDEG